MTSKEKSNAIQSNLTMVVENLETRFWDIWRIGVGEMNGKEYIYLQIWRQKYMMYLLNEIYKCHILNENNDDSRIDVL